MDTTFAQDLEEYVGTDSIEAVLIGDMPWQYGKESYAAAASARKGELLSWADARSLLDYEYGYGGPDCNSVYIWTADSVIFVSQYDGSVDFNRIPRNPTAAVEVTMPGGGSW